MSKVILVTGGARSGKSSYGEKLARDYSRGGEENVAYLATAEAKDQEMRERIAAHRAGRPDDWLTFEEAFWPEQAFAKAIAAGCRVLLLDCLTMLASNWFCRLAEPEGAELSEQELWQKIQKPFAGLLQQARETQSATLILVTNEVGWGIVPGDAFTRTYRDLVGRINRLAAAAADEVWLVVAGQPLRIKPGQ